MEATHSSIVIDCAIEIPPGEIDRTFEVADDEKGTVEAVAIAIDTCTLNKR